MSVQKMCEEHAEEWRRWLDYKLPPAPRLIQAGTPSPARMREDRKARFEQWRDTIRTQQDLVRQACTAHQ